MGLPMRMPTPPPTQYMPVRVPITASDGESKGTIAPGIATTTLETSPQTTDHTIIPAVDLNTIPSAIAICSRV
ncbi:hypothetical protein BGW36DRAFT_382224 [Talaromyces proteolyticus]|uniref:Uncharacterized protein n=1 Tax=Talaromyces proteolyticus TaxID=1131652 RepID=A0AAD4PYX5_9EURO|nr:uncharacterized protein BGW36DRAFT_382224 [Talaromyces proteolyticus]KAH8695172.1 hypothetical protein BGW36DRAFT_382224 [Talaromyces proteolyticus]